jgi:dissimilatory sulfite reductase (desulfoviridin) alpha/beta subunit
MTPEKQRIAIAEACGFNCDPLEAMDWGSRGQWCIKPNDQKRELVSKIMSIPDYLNDLNAMHDAEKMLTNEQRGIYCMRLSTLLYGHCTTAAQRAEALLRTIGKWEESDV